MANTPKVHRASARLRTILLRPATRPTRCQPPEAARDFQNRFRNDELAAEGRPERDQGTPRKDEGQPDLCTANCAETAAQAAAGDGAALIIPLPQRQHSLQPREGPVPAPPSTRKASGCQRTGQTTPDAIGFFWQGHGSPGTRGISLGRERHRDRNTMQRDGTSLWMPPNPSKKQPGFVFESHRERCFSCSPAGSLSPPVQVAAASYALLASSGAV